MTPQEAQAKIEAIIASPKSFIKLYANEITISNREQDIPPYIAIVRDTCLFWHTYTVSLNLCIIPVESARKLWIQAEEAFVRQKYTETFKQLNTLHASLVNTSNIKH